MDFDGKLAVYLLTAPIAEMDGADGQRRFAPRVPELMPGGSMLACVDRVADHSHRRVKPLRLAADFRDSRVRLKLPVLPDQNLLVVPAETDADIGERCESVRRLRQQILTDRLCSVHDLGESVIVVRRLDEGGLKIARSRRRPGNRGIVVQHRKLDRREKLTLGARFQRWNTRGVSLQKIENGASLCRVIAVLCKLAIAEAAFAGQLCRQFERARAYQAQLARELLMAQAVGIDLSPANGIGGFAEFRVWRLGRSDRAMIGITRDRIPGTRAGKQKRLAIAFRQVLLDEDVRVGWLGQARIRSGKLETAGLVGDQLGEQGPRVRHGPAGPG